MKILVIYQTLLAFAFVRIKSCDVSELGKSVVVNKYPFGIKSSFPAIVYASAFILLTCTFCSEEVETYQEYTATIYPMATITINLFNFMFIFWKRKKIFEFIDRFELEIKRRKFK